MSDADKGAKATTSRKQQMSNIGGTSADAGMVRVMGIVGLALLLLAISIGLTANILGGGDEDVEGDALLRNAMIQRVEPVGRVRTSTDELPAEDVVAVADAGGAMRSGDELVQGACAACHVAGVAGAPKLDDEAAWAERRELGLDALVASVVNGKGSMPARGGSDYSDEEIRVAVQHIAMFEVEEAPAEEAPAEEAPAADAAVAPAAAPAAEEEVAAATDGETAPEGTVAAPANDMAENEMGGVGEANDLKADEVVTAPATEGAESEAAENADAALVEEVTDDQAAVSAAAATLVVGEAPAELPDHVKTTVDGVCAGCHIAGVANAPKIGDTAAWQERADLGLEALSASVINGKGVMPARGGSNLTDEEIPVAIQYLMSK